MPTHAPTRGRNRFTPDAVTPHSGRSEARSLAPARSGACPWDRTPAGRAAGERAVGTGGGGVAGVGGTGSEHAVEGRSGWACPVGTWSPRTLPAGRRVQADPVGSSYQCLRTCLVLRVSILVSAPAAVDRTTTFSGTRVDARVRGSHPTRRRATRGMIGRPPSVQHLDVQLEVASCRFSSCSGHATRRRDWSSVRDRSFVRDRRMVPRIERRSVRRP